MNPERARHLKDAPAGDGPVVYWMSRDQRVSDNWALLYARGAAVKRKAPLAVIFNLVPDFLGATIRQYGFMLDGLRQVEERLSGLGIPFFLLQGSPGDRIPRFVKEHGAGLLVTDFDPLRVKRQWKKAVVDAVTLPVVEVDAHNVVPCWIASPKLEYGAYTIRPKIHRLLPDFLDGFPRLPKSPHPWSARVKPVDWDGVRRGLKVDRTVPEVDWLRPGERAARRALTAFLNRRFDAYDRTRNDPSRSGQSDLSPYLHFGQLSAQRVALEVIKRKGGGEAVDTFLEELIVRRELSDNFCYYNPDYDRVEGFPRWARETLDQHRSDERDPIYSRDRLEAADTHDPLWNAAQLEMVHRGKMHGYMRMYWAKKILEWTRSPEEAMRIAIALNDRYELDGRDPNGYTGIAWSIGGVHDRAWGARPVFGKIRYMSARGAASKFDVGAYVEKVRSLAVKS